MKDLKLKVCGMREEENLQELIGTVSPNFVGFIFYPKSPRYVSCSKISEAVTNSNVQKVGVFVKSGVEEILSKAKSYNLDFIQLHGGEDLQTAKKLKSEGLGVIKVFSVNDDLPLDEMKSFESTCDYFLLDTKTKNYGGSGSKFDWDILKDYSFKIPFILSGGIGPEDIESIKTIQSNKLFGLDINSRFEVKPALKDLNQIEEFKNQLIQEQLMR